jgi:hypothetical protein
MIVLPDDVAAVVLDLAESMAGPVTPLDIAYNYRRCYYLVPQMQNAFEAAGVDAEDVERPEIPLLQAGSQAGTWKNE